MGCIIKLKGKNQFKEFSSIEEAKTWVQDNIHNISIEEFTTSKNKSKEYYLETKSPQESIVKTLQAAHNSSFEQVGEILNKMDADGFEVQEYSEKSNALSLMQLLKTLRIEDENGESRRLFPEFISSNYINTIYQNLILKKLKFKNTDLAEDADELVALRKQYFNENKLPEKWKGDNLLHSPKEWYLWLLKTYTNDFTDTLQEEDLREIEQFADSIQKENFEGILYGELGHKIFELIIKGKSIQQIEKAITDPDSGLFASFKKRYTSENYTEVKNPEESISKFEQQYHSLNLLSQYYDILSHFKTEIENKFRAANPKAEISWLSELMITADLDGTIDENKNKVRGKIDITIVVDGVPHIIDLKFSKKGYSEWNSAKVLKTDYQLGAYLRMLNTIGLSTSSTTLQVAAITYDKNGNLRNPMLVNRTSEISKQHRLNANLNTLFGRLQIRTKINDSVFEQVNKYFEKLFGTTTVNGRKNITEEQTYHTLKNNVRYINGSYRLSYWIFDEKSARRENKYTTLSDNKEEREKELRKLAKTIVENNNASLSIQYDTLVNDINGLLTGTLEVKDFISAREDVALINFYSALLLKYKSSGAKIIPSDLAKENNLILIKTDIGIDIISLSTLDINAAYDQTDKNASLFDINISSGAELKKTIGNVEITKALLVANELLKDSNETLNTITCIQLGHPKGHFLRKIELQNIADIMTSIIGISNNLHNKFTDPLTAVLYYWTNYINQSKKGGTENLEFFKMVSFKDLKSISKKESRLLKEIILGNPELIPEFNSEEKLNISRNIEVLKSLRDILKVNYPTLFRGVNKAMVTPETWLMFEIERAILIYENNEVADEVGLKRYALGSSTLLSPLDVIPNENAQIISRAINDAFTKVTERVTAFTSKNRMYVSKLKSAKNYGSIRQLAIGDTVVIYDNLFVRGEDGTIKDLVLKNPWTDQHLLESEREFIKFALFVLNKKRYKWKTVSDVSPENLTEVDYYVPLVRTTGLYKFRDANGKFNISVWRSTWEKMRQAAIDAGDLFEEQIQERKKASDNFENFYNQYSVRRNKEVRKDLLGRLGIQSFSTDLETILTEYTVAEESQEVFDNYTIPLVRSVLYVSQFGSYISGNDQEVFKEFIEKTVKSAIYNESVMSEEVQQYMKKLAPLREAAFFLSLAWNIANVPREIMMGFFTNISRAMFKAYGENSFSFSDYAKAIKIMSGDIPGFIKNVTKIEMLNEFYRMANMSITEIPEQVTSNKTGIMASFSRFLSWSLTAPDYWNRMSIFIAQMVHDGTWEAHTIEFAPDGSSYLKYDIQKDKRFDIFVKYKGNISEVPNSLKEKFNYQEALYFAMLDEMNSTSDSPYTYKTGEIPFLEKAYTNRQRASFKSFADTTFGYYDPEGKALFFKTAVGQIFKQYMAYFAGKKVQYYQTGSKNTARGDFKQLTDIKGENIWRIINDNNEVINKRESELTEQERLIAKPVLVWTGTYLEGIFQSYIHLLKELGLGTWGAIKGKDTDTFKKLYNEYCKRGNIRNSNMLQSMWDLLMGSFLMYLIRLIFFDDPEVTGISYNEQIKNSSSWTQFWYNTTNQATQDFDVAQLIRNGLFVWESPMVGILQRSAQNFWRNMGDEDLSLAEATLSSTVETVGFLKPLRPYMNNLKEDWKEE